METTMTKEHERQNADLTRYEYVRPLCDISETADHYHLAIQMPGVAKGDVSVHMKDNHLLVTGFTKPLLSGELLRSEIGYRHYRRDFSLGRLVDRETIEARWQDGNLILSIAKKEEAKPREIKITYNQ